MKCIALYSVKGGVGKSTLAANLAWASATLSSRATLLWDLDPQAGSATYLLGHERTGSKQARAVFKRDLAPAKLVQATPIERLSLIPSDVSLRDLNLFFHELGKKSRLAKLLDDAGKGFDRIILDCPPGLNETSAQVLRAADLIVVPVIPSPLSLLALDELFDWLDAKSIARNRALPVFNMVDRRRAVHLEALDDHAHWPAIPMSSAFEAMSAGRLPIGGAPRGSTAAKGLAELWRKIEWRLARV
jgi:cellulose biosynthesis protein BcsQ